MTRVWTWEDVGDNNLGVIPQAKKEVIAAKWNAWADKSGERKLTEIKRLRLDKLIETDYLALSDNTLSVAMSDYRQGLRDIPQNNTTEEQYDLILARVDRNLTHEVWSKP
tara:strand:+ start:276 stop:605 length:330 start_codon:yes stop_codon:yes gene_type:complete